MGCYFIGKPEIELFAPRKQPLHFPVQEVVERIHSLSDAFLSCYDRLPVRISLLAKDNDPASVDSEIKKRQYCLILKGFLSNEVEFSFMSHKINVFSIITLQ